MRFMIGQYVFVHRRIDHTDKSPGSPREWVEAMIVGLGISHRGVPSWRLQWQKNDNYQGPHIFPEDMLSWNKPPRSVVLVNIMDGEPVVDIESISFKPPEPKKVLHDTCPKCGHRGNFILMALACPVHGVWAGC